MKVFYGARKTDKNEGILLGIKSKGVAQLYVYQLNQGTLFCHINVLTKKIQCTSRFGRIFYILDVSQLYNCIKVQLFILKNHISHTVIGSVAVPVRMFIINFKKNNFNLNLTESVRHAQGLFMLLVFEFNVTSKQRVLISLLH